MKIGFACKYMYPDQDLGKKALEEKERPYKVRTTTLRWMNAQTKAVAEARLWDIMQHNIAAFYNLITYVGSLPEELRMIRLGSDVFPLYSEPTWGYFWKLPAVVDYCEKKLKLVGDLAREKRGEIVDASGSIYCSSK